MRCASHGPGSFAGQHLRGHPGQPKPREPRVILPKIVRVPFASSLLQFDEDLVDGSVEVLATNASGIVRLREHRFEETRFPQKDLKGMSGAIVTRPGQDF